MPMHKIPNFAFGTVARRHVVRIFLPRLWRQGEDPIVTPLHLARIYNRVVLPLVKEMFPNEATHWPASYRGAELLAQTCGQGGFARMGYDVQPDRLAEFGERVLVRLGEVDQAYRNAYFGHELRGYKGATAHNPDEEEEREGSLETMLSVLDRDQVDEDRWYIDVAMEFGRRGHVVTWASRSHAEILLAICPGLRREHVERRMKSKQYHLDRLSHLLEVAGFRAEMEFWGRKEVLWAQCYTTDKAASAQLHNGIFKTRWPSELLKESELDRLLRDMVKMSEMLAICAGKGEVEEGVEATAQDACARVEVRVTLAQALTDLVDLPDGLLERGLLQIPSWQWW
ncbi:hypothetical protein CONPUDRAFT_68403 [Coniophora puteana RWD-64-598 SS2]|uniref:Uncharacterized protein n=1 Tax=Coniophora puteana (strain RWD-64-598) TaxID=741705 RepID=R7SD56_CONPW|nr:uncharacterized protein CONPUDRAFT_68403 [Coniophora puteana RWD-64-598 SS2]EIW73780.1 hypothetical protein CONPUDRAFT_68403 [Coniophora puteana RWD-64-598 SS2]